MIPQLEKTFFLKRLQVKFVCELRSLSQHPVARRQVGQIAPPAHPGAYEAILFRLAGRLIQKAPDPFIPLEIGVDRRLRLSRGDPELLGQTEGR